MRGVHRSSGKLVTILGEDEKFGQPRYRVRFPSGLITTWRKDAIDILPSDQTATVPPSTKESR